MNPIINRPLNFSRRLLSVTGKGLQTNISIPKLSVITEKMIFFKDWRKLLLKSRFVSTLEEERQNIPGRTLNTSWQLPAGGNPS